MKKAILTTFLCLMGFSFIAKANAPWSSAKGNGTLSNPWIIETPDHLNALATAVNGGNSYSGYYFSVAEDITCNKVIGNSLFTPFEGSFDGRGYTITLNISQTGNKNYLLAGLFGAIGGNATITNVTVNGTVSMNQTGDTHFFAGGIAAVVLQGAKIRNSVAFAQIKVNGESSTNNEAYIGCIAGYNLGTIGNVFAGGSILPITNRISTVNMGTAVGHNGTVNELFKDPYTINGTIVSEQSTPINGAQIELRENGIVLATTTSNSNGSFSFPGTILFGENHSLTISVTGFLQKTITPSYLSGTTIIMKIDPAFSLNRREKIQPKETASSIQNKEV